MSSSSHARSPGLGLRLLLRQVEISLNKCEYNMYMNFFWNFHSNVWNLTIYFIDLNVSVGFVLIYRPHPVYINSIYEVFLRMQLYPIYTPLHWPECCFKFGTEISSEMFMNSTSSVLCHPFPETADLQCFMTMSWSCDACSLCIIWSASTV